MTREVLLSLLRQGSTGSEILQILDNIDSGNDGGEFDASVAEPTLSAIQF
jgi:hypothetical protein